MLNEYAVRIRRELHQVPELGLELPKTLAILRRELDKIGIGYTEKFGKSSIVATLNPEKAAQHTIGIRADMDALPITEQVDVPYKSTIEGHMHACGHDAHTAILLTTLRDLYAERDKISCCVKFLFQPCEEAEPSGAKLMAEDGVMDDIDEIIALHVEAKPVGTLGICEGMQGAISDGFYLNFTGKAAHAANQQVGVDAITTAIRAYTSIEFMIAKEFPAREPVIFNVGQIVGGKTNNVIAESCSMFCTLRTWTESVAEKALTRIKEIIAAEAAASHAEAEFVHSKHYPNVYNDPAVTARLRNAMAKVVGEDHLYERQRTLGGEDFSYFASQKPGAMFRLGIRNPALGAIYDVHNALFTIDEEALDIGVRCFKQYVYDNMDGAKAQS